MSLGERISQARKRAGLSQEQLGEQLGVSRQAVSKWESGQTNPDVSYVARMCRVLEVSSDWLLLEEESAREDPPARCPDCQAIVSGLDKFCPACGRSLWGTGRNSYTVLLRVQQKGSGNPTMDLVRLSGAELFPEPSPLAKPLTLGEAANLAASAPLVLGRGFSKDYLCSIYDCMVYPNNFLFLQDCEEEDPKKLAEYPGIYPKAIVPREPMSFGMTALAVGAGIIGAAFFLMFL